RWLVDRRRFLQVSGTAVAALASGRTAAARAATAGSGSAAAGTAMAGSAAADTAAATPIRPPAAPLIVRSPYLSTWQPSTVSPGTWQTFWNGDTTALAGIVRIDGT